MLLLGKVSSQTSFEPQHAIVVRDKDEVLITVLYCTVLHCTSQRCLSVSLSPSACCWQVRAALSLAVIPTQKEFRRAVQSLSRSVEL